MRAWLVLALVVVAAAVAGGFALRGEAGAARSGQIAWKGFTRAGDESTSAIYAANPDGSHLRPLTHPGARMLDDLPDWSPDGSHVLFMRIFQSDIDPPTVPDQVMRVNADGSGLRQIGTCSGACLGNDDPQYSPDGRQIVYTRAIRVQPAGAIELGVWVMDANGTRPRQITQRSRLGTTEDHEPAWSPNGKYIVFTRLNDTAAPVNEQALFVIARGGGKPRRITSWNLNAGGANWSPDGSRILFQSYRDCSCSQTSQVYTVAPDGSGVTKLTGVGRNIEPNWSPDGTKIVYAHEPGRGSLHLPDLWVMDPSGGNKHPVVQTKLWESEPDWGTAAPLP
jgi:Tol biopolymer transport system component